MSITVTSTEAKNNFGEMIRLAKSSKEGVVVKQYGDPTVVILAYDQLKELEKDSRELKRRKALERLKELRNEIQSRLPEGWSAEDSYREAGFSEEVIRETLAFDEVLRMRAK